MTPDSCRPVEVTVDGQPETIRVHGGRPMGDRDREALGEIVARVQAEYERMQAEYERTQRAYEGRLTGQGPDVLSAFVPGLPAPQGSKRHVGRGVMVEMSKALKPWREDVAKAVRAACRTPFTAGVPVHVELEFVMHRPVATPKRSTPPAVKRPDVDKLCRAVLDGISIAKAWGDDSQVTHLCATKRIAEIGETPGCHIQVSEAS